MIKWEDLSPLWQLRNQYSDLHKDVFGYRPDYEEVDKLTEFQLQERFNHLLSYLEKGGYV
jgi:hypothetical protein